MTTLSTLTVSHLGSEATDADLAAFKTAVAGMVAKGHDEPSAIEYLWNQGDVLEEARV